MESSGKFAAPAAALAAFVAVAASVAAGGDAVGRIVETPSAGADFDPYQGAWAAADKPHAPIVVVDRLFVWMNTNGCWRPCRITGSESDPPAPIFTDYADKSPVHLCLMKAERRRKGGSEGKDAAVPPNDVFMAKRAELNGRVHRFGRQDRHSRKSEITARPAGHFIFFQYDLIFTIKLCYNILYQT